MGKLVAIGVTVISGLWWSVLSYIRHGSWPPWYISGGSFLFYLVFGLWVGNLYDRAHYLALHDPLTGLYNRRYLVRELARRLAMAKRRRLSMAVLLIDVDNFKHGINDRFGHLVGDKVLQQVAAAIRQSTGRRGIVGRWGGEEFAVIAPVAGVENVSILAGRIHESVARCTDPHVTVSIGIATYPQHGKDPDSLMNSADKALYAAKGIKKRAGGLVPFGPLYG